MLTVHCEPTSGILNPVEEVVRTVKTHDRVMIVDAMSAFGAIGVDAAQVSAFDAVMASSTKCLEGFPAWASRLSAKAC